MNTRLCLAGPILALAGCYLHSYPVTPTVAEAGTYELFSDDSQGTAWAVDARHLVTAGHMCEGEGRDYVAVGSTGRRVRAQSVQWEYGHSGLADVCLLESAVDLPAPLIIADRMPAIGDPVGFVGWPMGSFTRSAGKYLGDVDGPDSTMNDAVFTAPCDHGASGSAVFTSRGVWGVLVRVRTDGGVLHPGTEGCVAIPLPQLRAFLDDSPVRFTVTPELPPEPDWDRHE
jgi:hypothetical protein